MNGWTATVRTRALPRTMPSAPSVVDRLDPQLGQLRHALAHVPDHLRRRRLPARDLLDDPQRLGRSVRAGRVAGKALVGDIRVVFDWSERDPVDPSRPVTASELGSQWRALARGGQVDVLGLAPLNRSSSATPVSAGHPDAGLGCSGRTVRGRRPRAVPEVDPEQAVEPSHEDRDPAAARRRTGVPGQRISDYGVARWRRR